MNKLDKIKADGISVHANKTDRQIKLKLICIEKEFELEYDLTNESALILAEELKRILYNDDIFGFYSEITKEAEREITDLFFRLLDNKMRRV